MIPVGSLTAKQIDAEIAEMVKLERARDLTVDGSFRLRELRRARAMIVSNGRRWSP